MNREVALMSADCARVYRYTRRVSFKGYIQLRLVRLAGNALYQTCGVVDKLITGCIRISQKIPN